MSLAERSKRWAELRFAEEQAAKKALNDSETLGPARREALSRDYFEALATLLFEYARSHGRPNEGGPLEPFPGAAIRRVATLADDLSTGRIHKIIHDVNAGGRPSRSLLERRDIAVALNYIEFARAGKIADRAFVKTVSEAFSVDRTTIRDWQKQHDDIIRELKKTPVELFPQALLEAGARYQFNRNREQTEVRE